MALESATYVNQLDPTLPTGLDDKAEGDDVMRLIKSTIVTSFPNIGGPVTATHAQLNSVTAKANRAGDTYTGAHDFTAATLTVATLTAGNSTTAPASTAFVQSALAAASSAPGAMILTIVAGTTHTAVSGEHCLLINVALTTVTLPASPIAEDTVWVTPGNGLATNVIARNGQNIMSLAEDMTINNRHATVCLRYVDATRGWRIV